MTKPLKVLVVEDSEDDTYLIIRELKRADYTVEFTRVDNAPDVLRELKNGKWDIIISDFSMPTLTGMEVLEFVKNEQLEIPFIIVSGVIGEDKAVSAMKAGAHDYLMKDSLKRLVPAVERELREYEIKCGRKRAEQALRESEDKYRTIFESTGTAMAIIDEDMNISLVNEETQKLFGYSSDDFAGKKWTDFIVPDDLDRMREYHSKRWTSGTVPSGYEFRLIAKDGNIRNVYLTIAVIPNTKKSIASLLDITERKAIERSLEKHVQELARSNAELRQFTYVASHDLQEPLRMISSYSQLISKRYKGRLDPDADEFIGFIVQSIANMKALLDDLLEYGRLGFRGRQFREDETKKALDQAIRNLKHSIQESGAVIEVGEMPVLYADHAQITQVFQNFISNAIKFRRQTSPRIVIAAEILGNEWRFSIKDNGIGIEDAYFEKIFEIFQRLHNRNTYPGTGIGLAICKKIIENHNGRIWVESVLDKGSTFYFTIPFTGDKNEHKDASKSP